MTEINKELDFGLIIEAGKMIDANAYIHTDKAKRVEPAQPPYFSLEEVQKAVGGYIEMVRLPHNNIMFVDEEGVLKNKPLNVAATQIAGQMIVGDAFVCGSNMVD